MWNTLYVSRVLNTSLPFDSSLQRVVKQSVSIKKKKKQEKHENKKKV